MQKTMGSISKSLNHKRGLKYCKTKSPRKSQFKEIEQQTRSPALVRYGEPHYSKTLQTVRRNRHRRLDDKDEMHKTFKDLFKKLALNLHPDRAGALTAEEREVRLSMFKDAKQALDNGDYFLLLEMSERFNIRIPKNFKQQTRWMKARIKQLDQEINNQKHTYNYIFSEAETESEKAQIVKNFLRQIFQI